MLFAAASHSRDTQIQLDKINQALPDALLRVLSIMFGIGEGHETGQSVAAVKDPDVRTLRHASPLSANNRISVKPIICASLCTPYFVRIIIAQRMEDFKFRFIITQEVRLIHSMNPLPLGGASTVFGCTPTAEKAGRCPTP